MPYQLFRTARIGTGTRTDAYRSALTRYIVADGTQDFWDWFNAALPVRYALAWASSAKLAECRADADIQALSPEASYLPAAVTWLDGNFSEAATAGAILENDGCSIAWVVAQTKRRAIMRYLCKLHVISQDMESRQLANALAFLARNLGTTRSQLTAAQRTAIQNWMVSRGLDYSWTVATTTVRQFLQYIIETIDWPVMKLGPLDLT